MHVGVSRLESVKIFFKTTARIRPPAGIRGVDGSPRLLSGSGCKNIPMSSVSFPIQQTGHRVGRVALVERSLQREGTSEKGGNLAGEPDRTTLRDDRQLNDPRE